jgi:hypothetical protein
MTQDETQVEGASDVAGTPASEAETKLGPILETLAARITVRYPAERSEEHERIAKLIDLTNDAVAGVIKQALENDLDLIDEDGTDDFTVNVTVEKV